MTVAFLKGFDFGENPTEVINLLKERGFFSMVAVGTKAFAFGGKYVDTKIFSIMILFQPLNFSLD